MSENLKENVIYSSSSDNNQSSQSLPIIEKKNTIAVLESPLNGKVYVVGTAHFSLESQKEVIDLIRNVKPNFVVLELCHSRTNILKLDEETILQEAKDMNLTKMMEVIKKTSVIHGILQSLLIRIYAKVTEELGMAPGGEFRVAYKEALKIPGCKLVLGDMPVDLTLSRGFSSLPWYRKLKLGWMLFSTDAKLTKEDIEEMKKSDILDALLKEFGSSFPEFKRVLIDERDMYLTYSLRKAGEPLPNESAAGGFVGAKVVGVVGLGHLNGIKNNWNKDFNIDHLLKKNDKKQFNYGNGKYGKYFKYSIFLGTVAVIAFQCRKYLKK